MRAAVRRWSGRGGSRCRFHLLRVGQRVAVDLEESFEHRPEAEHGGLLQPDDLDEASNESVVTAAPVGREFGVLFGELALGADTACLLAVTGGEGERRGVGDLATVDAVLE